jgi:hypothetical protein
MNNVRQTYLALATVVASLTLALASPVYAAGTISGQQLNIINVYGSSTTPYAVLSFSAAASTPPACTQFSAAMAIDASTTRGKAQLSLVTAAFLAGKNVTVIGSGSCVTPAGFGVTVETINYVSVQ